MIGIKVLQEKFSGFLSIFGLLEFDLDVVVLVVLFDFNFHIPFDDLPEETRFTFFDELEVYFVVVTLEVAES